MNFVPSRGTLGRFSHRFLNVQRRLAFSKKHNTQKTPWEDFLQNIIALKGGVKILRPLFPLCLFSQPVASLKDYDTRCCWGEWREELYEKFDAQKGVLTLWPWNAHGAGVDEKKVFTAPRTIIFSNYSNWTFNLSLFNFAIKSEIEHNKKILQEDVLCFLH